MLYNNVPSENIINFLSNITNSESFILSNLDKNTNIIMPWYVTGFTDGEGSFQITIQDIKGKGLTGYKPFLEFKITQKSHSIDVLIEIKKYFKCGRISIDNRKTDTVKYVVTNINDIINKVIPHFDQYSLMTSKYLNYFDFKLAALLMSSKDHYSMKGIEELKNIKLKMNKGRSFEEKFHYCWSKPIILEPNWIQGFIDGEASFQCDIIKPQINRVNSTINFSLQIKQNNHDVAVLSAIRNFFRNGYLKPKYDIKSIEVINNLPRKSTILWIRNYEVVCQFLDKYPLYTKKWLDYLDWKSLIELKLQKAHLTNTGLNRMYKIKGKMNSKRNK